MILTRKSIPRFLGLGIIMVLMIMPAINYNGANSAIITTTSGNSSNNQDPLQMNKDPTSSAPITPWKSDYLVDEFNVTTGAAINRTYNGFLGKCITIVFVPSDTIMNSGGVFTIADVNYTNVSANNIWVQHTFSNVPTMHEIDQAHQSYIIFEKEDWSSDIVDLHVEDTYGYQFKIQVYNTTSKEHIPGSVYGEDACMKGRLLEIFKVEFMSSVQKYYSNIMLHSGIIISLIVNETLGGHTAGRMFVTTDIPSSPVNNSIFHDIQFQTNNNETLVDNYVAYEYADWNYTKMALEINNTDAYPLWVKIEVAEPCCMTPDGDYLLGRFELGPGDTIYRHYCNMKDTSITALYFPKDAVGSDNGGKIIIADQDYKDPGINKIYYEKTFAVYPLWTGNMTNTSEFYNHSIFAYENWTEDGLDVYIEDTSPYNFVIELWVTYNGYDLNVSNTNYTFEFNRKASYKVSAGSTLTLNLNYTQGDLLIIRILSNVSSGDPYSYGALKISDQSWTNYTFYTSHTFKVSNGTFGLFGRVWQASKVLINISNSGDFDFIIEIGNLTILINNTPVSYDKIPGFNPAFMLLSIFSAIMVIVAIDRKKNKFSKH
ncbi:MAG: hypothetical protein ACTSU2_10355 [Promethearchaeota archaeon]